MSKGKILVYLVRRDLRVADNPILHHLTTKSDHGYTHLLPIYVFDPLQIEISGFLKNGEESPYSEARSAVGGYWRTGPHRAKFVAQSVWDLKQSLEQLNSGLMLRFGPPVEVVKQVIKALKGQAQQVAGVYMTEEKSSEEVDEQRAVEQVCKEETIDFKLWQDEKYFIDDRDTGLEDPKDLPDIFTSYRKMQEPLRERPRTPLPRPEKSKILPLPDYASAPSDDGPFIVPRTEEDCEARLLEPLKDIMTNPPPRPDGVGSAHPFTGGETHGWERIENLIKSGGMTKYKETRNGLLGPEFSTKLSAYLALGCITARQIQHELLKFEDGKDEKYKGGSGYGQGENDGTRGVRFELLWRDYMRLCTMKFGKKLFRQHGFREKKKYDREWKSADASSAPKGQNPSPAEVAKLLERIWNGTTGLGLIDASQRELYHTGYTSNRARQNVASFLAKHLDIDWRYGAEWYEMLLVDYDVSSNWSNWQYVAGVGNDPRGDERNFNPVKQAFDYDKEGSYVRSWVPELHGLERLECVFQVSTAKSWELANCGLEHNIMATHPIKRIQFVPNRKPRPPGKQHWRGGSGGRRGNGGRRGGGGRGGAGGTSNGENGNHNHGPNGTNGDSGSANHQQNGTNGNTNRGGFQHRGGHGRPSRGGESTRDASWLDDARSGKADGSSDDGAPVQTDLHPHQHHQLQHFPSVNGPRTGFQGPPTHGDFHSEYNSQPGHIQTGFQPAPHDKGQRWYGQTGRYASSPYGTIYPGGMSPVAVMSPPNFGNVPMSGQGRSPESQSWMMAAQYPPTGYFGYAEPMRNPGYMSVPLPLPPGPQIPMAYPMAPQPLPIPQPRPHVSSKRATPPKQMSVEAQPFVPGDSPVAVPPPGGMIMVQPEASLAPPGSAIIVPPVGGSESSETGSSGDFIPRVSSGPQGPPAIANGTV
ncbi:FAD binding domain of DNA photolyase domain-containing protein [Sarocladium implicatum]|nr:FAD binding domain of DNA photolyase domain-containing protein [Sarocladium implicatum]